MRLTRIAELATIIGIFPALYSAYASYQLLHSPASNAAASESRWLAVTGHSAVVSVVIAAILILIGASINLIVAWKYRSGQMPQNVAINPVKVDIESFYKGGYTSSLNSEVEKHIWGVVEHNKPAKPLDFLVRFMAFSVLLLAYELCWAYIYRSQLLLLLEVNKRPVPLPEGKQFYARAALENPQSYRNYEFEQWIGFLKTNVLLTEQPVGVLQITDRGRDFLKFLTHHGRYPNDRRN